MKRLVLFAAIALITFNSYSQTGLPIGSVYLGNGIYGNKVNEIAPPPPPPTDCPCCCNPIKADTSIEGMPDSGLVLLYNVPPTAPSMTYSIGAYWIGIHNAGYTFEYMLEWVDRTLTPRSMSLGTMSGGAGIVVDIPTREIRAAGGTNIILHVITHGVGGGVVNMDIGATISIVKKP